jgi:MoxR-vWA-beta-propeller ternary system domain bpX5
MTQLLKINRQNRFDSLQPSALVVFGVSMIRLKDRLLLLDDEKLSNLQGVFAENLMFITGEPEKLPWIDGGIYLGKDVNAPSIFLPTNLRPTIPIDLFEKALLSKFAAQKPFAVIENQIIPIGKMRPISRRILNEIL